ncbi:MAG: hypothetical protein M1840_008371 [Geoglossum simile]|nr:MAG: hypothetical protein M1840_008371 [Geoglossum simile]
MLATHPQKPRCSNKNLQQLEELSPPTYGPSNGQSKPDSATIHLIGEFSYNNFEGKGRAILKRLPFPREREFRNGKPPAEHNGPPQLNASKERKADYSHGPLNTNPNGPHTNSSRPKKPLMRERFKIWEKATVTSSLTTTPAAAVTPPPSKGERTKALPERRTVSIGQHVLPNLDPVAASAPTNDRPSINSNPMTEQRDTCGERQGGVGLSAAPPIRPDVGQVRPTGNRDDNFEGATPSEEAGSPGTSMGALHEPDERSASLAGVVVSGHQELLDDSLQNHENIVLPVNLPMIYRLGQGLYVGKMQEITPPWDMAIKWQNDVRVRLVQDLIPLALGLPRSNNSDDLIIEPELCMTGATTGKSLTVRLEPTVWIRCGGKVGRKAVRKAVSHLDYLHAFSRGPVQVQLRGPRLASNEQNNLSST